MKNPTEVIESNIDISSLKYPKIGESVYANGRQVMVRGCHDAYISYTDEKGNKGIILVRRASHPAKGHLWAFGGGIERGFSILESLAIKIKEESGLDIYNPVLIDVDRYRWGTTPNKNVQKKRLPKGIDDLTLIFYCEGKGKLSLNYLHKSPIIVTKEMYTDSFQNSLFPSVRKNMDLAMLFLK